MASYQSPKDKAAAMRAIALANIAKRRVEREAEEAAKQQQKFAEGPVPSVPTVTASAASATVGQYFTQTAAFQPVMRGMEYNAEQSQALERGMRGQSFCLIGAAGTGKTTVTQELIGQLQRLPHVVPFMGSTNYIKGGEPGMLICSFTNKAVNNIRKRLSEQLKKHCLTIHKILEYMPIRDGSGKIVGFGPTYTSMNKLPHISVIIVEESSMVGTDLWDQLMAALPMPDKTQFIFLGDLNQLPPVFGYSILGFKMVHLPVVELTTVYRQALLSPIIDIAHKIRGGKGMGRKIVAEEVLDGGEHGKVVLRPWKKKMTEIGACRTACAIMFDYMQRGLYDPDQDQILCPFNKKFGTIEINNEIAQHLGKARGAVVWEIIAGRFKQYLAVGDKVLVDRLDAKILEIRPTLGYKGKIPQLPSKTLDRWGNDPNGEANLLSLGDDAPGVDKDHDPLDFIDLSSDNEERTNTASHTVKVQFLDDDSVRELSSAGDVGKIQLAYALTVHKSQGSEWPRVFLLFHWSHNSMLSRELVYTAVTRARKELYVVMEPDKEIDGMRVLNSLTKAAQSPEIKGTSLAEKIAFFNSKAGTLRKLNDNNED